MVCRVSPATSPDFSCEKTNRQKQEQKKEKWESPSPRCGAAQAAAEPGRGGLAWKSPAGRGALGEVWIPCGMLGK